MKKRVKILIGTLTGLGVSAVVLGTALGCTITTHRTQTKKDAPNKNSSAKNDTKTNSNTNSNNTNSSSNPSKTSSSSSKTSSSSSSSSNTSNASITSIFNTLAQINANDFYTLYATNCYINQPLTSNFVLNLFKNYLANTTTSNNTQFLPAILTTYMNVMPTLSVTITGSLASSLSLKISTSLSDQTLTLTYSATQLQNAINNFNNIPNEIVSFLNTNSTYTNAMLGCLFLNQYITYNKTSSTYTFNIYNDGNNGTSLNSIFQNFIYNNAIQQGTLSTNLLTNPQISYIKNNNNSSSCVITFDYLASSTNTQLNFKIGVRGIYSTDSFSISLSNNAINTFLINYNSAWQTYLQDNIYQISLNNAISNISSLTTFFNNSSINYEPSSLMINNFVYQTNLTSASFNSWTSSGDVISSSYTVLNPNITYDIKLTFNSTDFNNYLKTQFDNFATNFNKYNDFISFYYEVTSSSSNTIQENINTLFGRADSTGLMNLPTSLLPFYPSSSLITDITNSNNIISFKISLNGITSQTLTLNTLQLWNTNASNTFISVITPWLFLWQNPSQFLTSLQEYNSTYDNNISFLDNNQWPTSLTSAQKYALISIINYAIFGTYKNTIGLGISSYKADNGTLNITFNIPITTTSSTTFNLILPNISVLASSTASMYAYTQIISTSFINNLMLSGGLNYENNEWTINDTDINSFIKIYNKTANNISITSIVLEQDDLIIYFNSTYKDIFSASDTDVISSSISIPLTNTSFSPTQMFNNLVSVLNSSAYKNWLENEDYTIGGPKVYEYVYQYFLNLYPSLTQSTNASAMWEFFNPFNVQLSQNSNNELVISLSYNNVSKSITINTTGLSI